MSIKQGTRNILLLIAVIFIGILWFLFGSNTNFIEEKKSLYIKTGSNFDDVMTNLEDGGFVKNTGTFKLIATIVKYDKNIRPGKYVINKGASIYNVLRLIRSGRQTAVNLVITKLRTKDDLAEKLAANFESDAVTFMAFLNNNDSLQKYQLDSNTVMTAVIPNSYSFLWNTSPARIFKKLFAEQEKFWTKERRQKAAALQLTTQQVYTLASIVEEETNMEEDKGKIASVYLNRLEKGMKLAADPTVKFAMQNFGLKRIYFKQLEYPSPYNTYQHTGLPPGPICTPSPNTIDAVLNAPATTYLYFVAKPDLQGYSNFATTYEEHLKYAKAYQQALDSFVKENEPKSLP